MKWNFIGSYGMGLICCFHVLRLSFAACKMKGMVLLFFNKKNAENYCKGIKELIQLINSIDQHIVKFSLASLNANFFTY